MILTAIHTMLSGIAAYCWFFTAMFFAQINYLGNNVPAKTTTTKKTNANTTKPSVAKIKQKTDLPKVFIISDDQASFEQLSALYNATLMDACKDNDETAYSKWTNMMHAFEQHAEKNNINIKGVKMWVKVFWATDGTVDHVGYFLKPNSRNVKIEELSALWRTFQEKYHLPMDEGASPGKFSNYGSVSFPLYMR
jgi:hypothetical protein